MSPMIPDCGVLTTPRRSLPIKLNGDRNIPQKSPKPGSFLYNPPTAEPPGVTLSSGFSFSFYKSPKLPVTPVRRVEVRPLVTKVSKHRRDVLNKGVTHKIKKPKPKSKEVKKKTRNVKQCLKRLKEGNFTPCPWTPANRSPVKRKPKSEGNKKRHTLSSPGMSLLENDISSLDDAAEYPDKDGRFFTSRSRASANVKIAKNIQLAAKKGDISLKQRDGPFMKKNIGRVVEEELNKFIVTSPNIQSTKPILPSVKANPRPMPTRVACSPSPPKQSVSPRKGKKLFNPTQLVMSNDSSGLQDLDAALDNLKSTKPSVAQENDVPKRRSPRKSNLSLTPVKKTPVKSDRFGSPIRSSPRKSSLSLTPVKRSPMKGERLCSPLRRSPRKCSSPYNTPNKVSSKHPEKNVIVPGAVELSPNNENHTGNDEASQSQPSVSSPTNEISSSKLYPVFNRDSWRSDATPSPKTGKKCSKHHNMAKSSASQMVIDAGQKEFGTRHCPDCDVLYEIANQEDAASHDLFHNSVNSALKFLGWKKENLVRDLDELGGRVVMVSSKDPSHCWRKVEEVVKVVDDELGYSEKGISVKENTSVFLYVLDLKVVGCLIAESIRKANRVIPSKSLTNLGNRLLCCSQEQATVWAGVNRLWVFDSQRGKGIASKLVDIMRCHMVPHHILSRDEIAFSDPTESGARFAEKYSGKRDFLVYRH